MQFNQSVYYVLLDNMSLCLCICVCRIDRQNDVIQQSLRRVAEIQEDGQNISIMLAQNRETLDTIHNKVYIHLDYL